jgi:hypothetical protein
MYTATNNVGDETFKDSVTRKQELPITAMSLVGIRWQLNIM